MNNEQEGIQFLGFIGILSESCKLVSSRKKLFSQITLSFILPLSFIYLAPIQFRHILEGKIIRNELTIDHAPEGTRSYNNILFSEWTTYLLQLGHLVFVLILSLLSTSAVVYTIACIYTAKDLTFNKVMSVVPKVWKRLMVTFVWSFVFVFVYNLVSGFVLVSVIMLSLGTMSLRTMDDLIWVWAVPFVALLVIYLIGIVYITMIWHLASVVSVLEESYGLKAMAKSQVLIKGKMGVTVAVFVLLGLCFLVVHRMFERLAVDTDKVGNEVGNNVGYWLLCLALMSILMLFGLVAQTVIYFVCKSYHHENIDKSLLSDHLGGYLREYAPLKTKDVQLEHCKV